MQGKKIILGITGSIAAYKSAVLVRLLKKEGAEVQVVMTDCAKEFITTLTMSTLSQRPVLSNFFDPSQGSWNSHVDLGLWADLMLIAPATANTLAKMSSGICDNLLLTTYLSARCPVVVAPAMDLDMYAHTATQHNLNTLKNRGVAIIEPSTGFLASGLEGKGRMAEPQEIIDNIKKYLIPPTPLRGKKILITAGPTYEKIDPVRFIGNYSSGKMGYAIAEEFVKQGAEVILVSGPVSIKTPENVKMVNVESAKEMMAASVSNFPECDGAILAAAVADFAPDKQAENKIKRTGDEMIIRLLPNPDIAKHLGEIKKKNQTIGGFALETNDEVKHALDKMKRKNFDFIVLNSLNDAGAGFRVDTNKISILESNGNQTEYPLKTKRELAVDIVNKWTFINHQTNKI